MQQRLARADPGAFLEAKLDVERAIALACRHLQPIHGKARAEYDRAAHENGIGDAHVAMGMHDLARAFEIVVGATRHRGLEALALRALAFADAAAGLRTLRGSVHRPATGSGR